MFKIEPVLGGGVSYAKEEIDTPHGQIVSRWIVKRDRFKISVIVPDSTTCRLKLPNGEAYLLKSGSHCYECHI